MNFSTYRTIGLLGSFLLVGTFGCTDLDDTVLGNISASEVTEGGTKIDPNGALQGAYAALNNIAAAPDKTFAMEEHPSDEMMGPTRGTDWDDFGTWRKLHQHTWTPDHNQITNAWDDLNSGIFKATQAISAAGSNNQIKAEASFLRAFFMFYVVDLYGQVPFREVNENAEANPKVFTRSQAVDYLIKDLEFAVANLGTNPPNKATKEAAQFLLAKVYLNKAVYKQDPSNPAGPFTFAREDMDKVIEYGNAVIKSGKFALQPSGKYFDNFHPENSTRSKELIFTIANDRTAQPGNVRTRYYMTLHYNQKPSSWNGFTTLSEFYNSFDKKDERLGAAIPGITDVIGTRAGFLVGQQNDEKGNPLKTRNGSPLAYTPNVNLGYATEAEGIRVIKYQPEPGFLDSPQNDYVFFRYADLLLMKAEAIMRGGKDPMGETTEAIVNNLRKTRGVGPKNPVDAKAMLAERGYELYWEGWRRNDQIRFGTFLDPVDQRPQKSPATAVLFPIPQRAIDSNPNLRQNPGY
ncbi:RagB/SusD family nutrient uptake outer membrane protein [Larkinella soli]|uniref:RagB/SusD family nutrient uptake outer membrane protein n=1 Tax=Larkinella soli TaxID=1770527 RepID=UPI000FFBF60A|nr:RagB/SusD family nutrient uptake outer membrane protein [Larkinella soli]